MNSFPSDLNPKQTDILQQFKEKVKDVPTQLYMKYGDEDYAIWLRARHWDLKKAEKMFRDSMVWRKKIDADNVLNRKEPEVLTKYYPGGFFGEDKEGYPVYYELIGYMDVKGMSYSAHKNDIIEHKIRENEHMRQVLLPAACKKHGRRIDKKAMIFDMEGIGRKHLWKPVLDATTEMLAMAEANYPETLQYCIIINAPAIFPIIFNICKPFISEDTKKKVFVRGKNWKDELLNHIDADQLPVYYGGKATDENGDPKCSAHLNWGGKVPEEYKKNKPEVDLSKLTVQTVGRGSTLHAEAMVHTKGLIITWQFWTEAKDIGFGVFRRTAEGKQKKDDMVEIIRSERVNCHIIPEEGSLACEEIGTCKQKKDDMVEILHSERVNSHIIPEEGSRVCEESRTYVLRFDNTYSWVNSKKIYYTMEVLEPAKLEGIHAENFMTAL